MFISFIVRLIFEIGTFLFINAGELLLSINSKTNELQADKFAHMSGYGRELISALYILQKISLHGKVRLMQRLKATHPHIAYRIQCLERLENENIQ